MTLTPARHPPGACGSLNGCLCMSAQVSHPFLQTSTTTHAAKPHSRQTSSLASLFRACHALPLRACAREVDTGASAPREQAFNYVSLRRCTRRWSTHRNRISLTALAQDTPWLSQLANPMSSQSEAPLGTTPPDQNTATSYLSPTGPTTHAAFSPVTLSANTPSRSARRSTILVHQKSPLLLATPPQITRALAYSHPFILPLNTFVGLLTWSTGDSWQSFLLLCAFWAVVLYGDLVLRWAGPVVVGMGLIAGMYGRRYSPLSSSGWSEPARDFKDLVTKGGTAGPSNPPAETNGPEPQKKHARGNSEVTNTKHQKTLDEIVETLKELTARCNALMEPLLEMTDFLSTQRTPTSATTKPALTAMFMRLLIVTPFWVTLTAPPLRVVTTRRVVLVAGTVVLTWHARVMRVSRAILWRSATVRRLSSAITGLNFDSPPKHAKDPYGPAHASLTTIQQKKESELTKSLRRPSNLNVNHHRRSGSKARTAGVKFTFIIYENQRRWVGLGWTNSLFAYERPAWTDEHNNAVPERDAFELPEVEDGSAMRWRWAEGSRWKVDGVPDEQGPVDYDGEEGKNGWIYYDSKVRLPYWTFFMDNADRISGKTAAEDKMAGDAGPGEENGSATPNSSKSKIRNQPLKWKCHTNLTLQHQPPPYLQSITPITTR